MTHEKYMVHELFINDTRTPMLPLILVFIRKGRTLNTISFFVYCLLRVFKYNQTFILVTMSKIIFSYRKGFGTGERISSEDSY